MPQARYAKATQARLNRHGAGPFCRFDVRGLPESIATWRVVDGAVKPHGGLDHDSPSQGRPRSLVFGGDAHRGYVGQVPGGRFKKAHARNRLLSGHKQAPLAHAIAKHSGQALCAVLKVERRQSAGLAGGQRSPACLWGDKPDGALPIHGNGFQAIPGRHHSFLHGNRWFNASAKRNDFRQHRRISQSAGAALSVIVSASRWTAVRLGGYVRYLSGASANASGGTRGYQYNWRLSGATITNFANSRSISLRSFNGAAATVSCTVTDSAGTSISGSAIIPAHGGVNV